MAPQHQSALADDVELARRARKNVRVHDNRAQPDLSGKVARSVTMRIIACFCSVCGMIWGALYLEKGELLASAFPLAFSVLVAGALLYSHVTRNPAVLLHLLLVLLVLMPFLLHVTLGGFLQSSASILWSGLTPIGALFFHSELLFWRYLAFFALEGLIGYFLSDGLYPIHVARIDIVFQETMFLCNIIFPILGISMAAYIFFKSMSTEQRRIDMVSRMNFCLVQPNMSVDNFCHDLVNEAGIALNLEQLTIVIADETREFSFVKRGYADATSLEVILTYIHDSVGGDGDQYEAVIPIEDHSQKKTLGWMYAKRDRTILFYKPKLLQKTRDVLSVLCNAIDQLIISNELKSIQEAEMTAAKELAASKTKFLALMSHEMRTPLQGILGMNEMMYESDLTEDQREFSSHIRSSSELLISIVSSVLDQSKLDAGKMELESISFDVVDMLETVGHLAEGRVSQIPGVEIAFLVDRDVPQVCVGDPMRLQQVLLNLCGNASKFTTKGSIIVRVEVAQVLSESEVRLRVSVKDSGVGIEKSNTGKLFRDYSQASASTARKFGGTGLGLSICKGIVELMGGRIWVESEYGRGSTFVFEVVLGRGGHDTVPYPPLVAPVCLLTLSDVLFDVTVLACQQNSGQWVLARTTDEIHADAALVLVDDDVLTDSVATALDRMGKSWCLLSRGVVGSVRKRELQEAGASAVLTLPVRPTLFNRIASIVEGKPAEQRARESNAKKKPHPAMLQGVWALVVDDDRTTRMLLSTALKRIGLHVDVASDGEDALAILNASDHRYKLIVTDHHMQHMHGPEFVQSLREYETRRGHSRAVVVVLSGDLDAKETFGSTVDLVLTKPLRKAELISFVEISVLST